MDAANMPVTTSLKWYEVWRQIYLHPSVESFLRILADPLAKPGRAYLWVAVMAVISGLLQGLGFNTAGRSGLGVSGPILTLGCGLIIAPVLAVIGLAFGSLIVHWIAGLFGGQGTFERMVYAYGAIEAPATLVSIIFSTLLLILTGGETTGGRSTLGLCAAPFSLVWGIYLLILQINAIRAVEKLSTGRAILTLLFPLILAVVLVGVCLLLTFPFAIQRGP